MFLIILRLQFQIFVSCIAVVPTRRMAGWSSITIKVCTTKNKYDTRSTITWNSKVRSAICHLYHYPCKHIYMKWFFSIYDIKGGEFVNQAIESKLSSLLPLQLLMSMQIKRKEQQSCNKPCQLEYLLQSHSSGSRSDISNSGKSCEISLPVCWPKNRSQIQIWELPEDSLALGRLDWREMQMACSDTRVCPCFYGQRAASTFYLL